MKKILVVGSKNTYRSIIVAEYLKKAINEKGNNEIDVMAAGIMALPGIPAEPEAVFQLKALNIEGDFKSQLLQKQYVAEADIILTVSEKIKTAITGKFADKSGIIHTVKEFSGEADKDLVASAGTGDEVKQAVDKSIDKILSI